LGKAASCQASGVALCVQQIFVPEGMNSPMRLVNNPLASAMLLEDWCSCETI
jgi:hypothetical protein